MMEKKFILVLALISFSLALQLHSQSPASGDAPFDPNTPQGKAILRAIKFIGKNPDLLEKLSKKQNLDEGQTKRFTKFMINDNFFRKMLLDGVTQDEQTKWVGKLSIKGQKAFLNIITDYTSTELDTPKAKQDILKRLLENKQISKALKKQFGDDLTAQNLQSAFKSVSSQPLPLHLLNI